MRRLQQTHSVRDIIDARITTTDGGRDTTDARFTKDARCPRYYGHAV